MNVRFLLINLKINAKNLHVNDALTVLINAIVFYQSQHDRFHVHIKC